MRTLVRHIAFTLCAASLVLPGAAGAKPLGHVRPLDSDAGRLITWAASGSDTITRMLEHLDRAAVIVYVEVTPLPPEVNGDLALLAYGSGWRFLRIRLARERGIPQTVGTLGHELQHALEVVAAPWVRDQDGMARLFREIGEGPENGPFETVAAQEVGKAVRREFEFK